MTEEVTIGELARGLDLVRAQQVALGSQVAGVAEVTSGLRADLRELATALRAHVERQDERTRGRDRELDRMRTEQTAAARQQAEALAAAQQQHDAEVAQLRADHDAELEALRQRQNETDKWRWTTAGRMAAVVAVAGGGSSGLVWGALKALSGAG